MNNALVLRTKTRVPPNACCGSMSVEATNCKPDNIGQRRDVIIPITSGEIHLWLTLYDEISGEGLLDDYRALLNPAEKEQESRFCFARDRHRYLVTRTLVRTVLSRYIAVDPKDWIFSTNAYGRPQILNKEATDCSLSFNISHTQGIIVLGVTKCRLLGVDVENIATCKISLDIANHYFARQEVAALSAVLPSQQQYRFFEYWTFKESYIKARGLGLSLPLDKFSFHYANDHAVELAIDPELGDDSARWQFWQFQPTTEHLLAACAERIDTRSSRLIVRETIPMTGEEIIIPKLLRSTEGR
jgi:4'-phosphopantetheinyl transferase